MLEVEWTPSGGGSAQIIDFDVATTERFGSTATVTEHAVEVGSAIADHVVPGNDTITIEAIASNTPIRERVFGLDGATGAEQSRSITVNGQQQTIKVFEFSQPFDRVKVIDTQMLAHIRTGQPLTVRTSLREIPLCVIESYEVNRDQDTGHILDMTLVIRVIRVATTQRVQVTDPAERRGQNRQNRGNQPAVDAAGAHDSVLGRLGAGNALAGFLGH